MEHEFDRGVHVEPSGPGEYAGHLDGGWVVGGGVNGGYVLAVVGNALRVELAELQPAGPAERERLLPDAVAARAGAHPRAPRAGRRAAYDHGGEPRPG